MRGCVAVWPAACLLAKELMARHPEAPWGVLLSSRRELKVVEMQIAGCKVLGP